MAGDKSIIVGDWAMPEFEYLQNNVWTFTEKVDGTNIRVYWDGESVTFGGRTDNAQIPNGVINRLNDLFYSTPARMRLKEVFPDGATLYGEGYGAGIQKAGASYRPKQDFVLFDVKVGEWWLERINVEDVAKRLELEIVPVIGEGTLWDAIELVKGNLISNWGDFGSEGIVARPKTELQNRGGERIITKIKVRDFGGAKR
jgi:hypothetical protein